jgi:predicted acyltransferase
MKSRLASVDVLRGLTVILMTVVNNPGDWAHVYPPLLHAEWNGCTPTDLVFPTFLFIVGLSTVLANPQRTAREGIYQKNLTRALRIFCLGLFLSFWSRINFGNAEGMALLGQRLVFTLLIVFLLFSSYDSKKQFYVAVAVFIVMLVAAFGGWTDFETVRIPGVLQRIAIVYIVVSLLYLTTGWKTQLVVSALLLGTYWALMTLVPVPGIGEANLTKGTNLAAWLDHYLLPGHLWITSKTWDPEGILSTIPAIATGLMGILTGKLLAAPLSKSQKALYLLAAGLLLTLSGLIWNIVFPFNKALWTSSYVLFAAGIAQLLLALLYYMIEIRQLTRWTKPFVIFGLNPMFVFFFSGIIPRVLGSIKMTLPGHDEPIGLQGYLYQVYLTPQFTDPRNASLSYALLYLLFWFFILYILYRKKLVFKV